MRSALLTDEQLLNLPSKVQDIIRNDRSITEAMREDVVAFATVKRLRGERRRLASDARKIWSTSSAD